MESHQLRSVSDINTSSEFVQLSLLRCLQNPPQQHACCHVEIITLSHTAEASACLQLISGEMLKKNDYSAAQLIGSAGGQAGQPPHSFIYLVVFQPSSPSQLPPPITRRLFISRVKHVGDCHRVQWITGRPATRRLSEWCAAESHLPMSSRNGMFTHVRFAARREKETSLTQRTPTRRLESSQTSDMTWEGLNEFSIYCCRIGLRISAWAPHLPPSVSLYRISLSGLSTRQSHR